MIATRFKVWGWGSEVGSGATRPLHVGVAGVAKQSPQERPYAVASELLCGNLARILLLPVPPSFIIENDTGIPHHVSLNFALAGENLPPVNPAAVVAHDNALACGIVLFDIWMGNSDRHAGNLAFDTTTNVVTIFDHSHAFLSDQDAAAWLTRTENNIAIGGHCLAPHVRDVTDFVPWAQKISQVPEYYIRGLVSECVKVGLPAAMVDPCVAHLMTRRNQLLQLIKDNAALFHAADPTAIAAL